MIGDANPDFILGFIFSAAWKGFDFSVLANGAFGHQIARSWRRWADSPQNNYTTDIFNRWHGEGSSNKYPRLTYGSHINWQYVSDIFIEDADYLKLSNVTLGYDFKRIFKAMPHLLGSLLPFRTSTLLPTTSVWTRRSEEAVLIAGQRV